MLLFSVCTVSIFTQLLIVITSHHEIYHSVFENTIVFTVSKVYISEFELPFWVISVLNYHLHFNFFSALYYKPQRVKSFKQKQKLAAIVLLANFLRAIWSKQELCSHQGQLEQKMGMLAYEQALVFRPGARVAKEKTLAHMPKHKANK